MLGRIFGSRPGTNEAANKFSAQYFNQLYQTLSQQLLRPSLQSEIVVHSLKDLGEVMVWAGKDKGVEPDPVKSRVTEMFGELPIMKTVVSIHKMAYGTAPEIQQQVLQTLSIILLNLAHDGSVQVANGSHPGPAAASQEARASPTNSSFYFLLSNGYINELMLAPFDDSDEEVLGYYISLMKTLSVAFNESTLNFFFTRQIAKRGAQPTEPVQEQAGGADFPMYSRAVAYADHDEGMVRAAVRTISLNVYRLSDPAMHTYILQHPQGAYPTILAKRIQRLLLDANDLAVRYAAVCSGSSRHHLFTCSASVFPGCIQVRHRATALAEQAAAGASGRRSSVDRSSAVRLASELSNACADIGDELYYLQDVLALDDANSNPAFQPMARRFLDAFLRIVVRPLLLGCPRTSHPLERSDHGVEPLEPSLRLHMLAEILRVITHQAFQRSVLAYLCKTIVPTFTQLDELIGPCIEDGSPGVFLALSQLLIVIQDSLLASKASDAQGHTQTRSIRRTRGAADDTQLHMSGSNGKPKLRLRSGSGAGSPRHELAPDTVGHSVRHADVEALGCTISRWCVLLASLSLPGPFMKASRAAAVILTRLQASGFGKAVTGPVLLCLAQAVSALATCAHHTLMRARDEDPIQAIGLLASCETLAFESISSSDVLPAATHAYMGTRMSRGQGLLKPVSRAPTPTSGVPAGTAPQGKEADDSAGQAYEMLTALSSSASSKDWHRVCNCWAVDVADMCVAMAVEPLPPLHVGDTDEQDSDASIDVEDRPLVWYDPYMLLTVQDDVEDTSWCSPYAAFQATCRTFFRLRSLLACLMTPGPLPLLQLARGLQFTAQQARYYDQGQVIDDLACNAFLVDAPLRSVAPPVDSIRPGNVFTLTAFQYYTAALYPTPTGTLSAPIAKGLPLAISRDPLAPLSAAVGSQRRVAVVLGQSYLVVAVVLSQKQSGQASAPAGVPPRVRGRAILVTPLHCTFVTPLPDAPMIVDVRVISTDEAVKGVCMDLGPWLPQSSAPAAGGGAASQALLRMQGFSLAFDAVEGPSKTVQHVEAARARVLLEKVEHLHALRKVDFRLQRMTGEEDDSDKEGDGAAASSHVAH